MAWKMKRRNDFQVGLDASRAAMRRQKGVPIRMDKSALSGHWDAPNLLTGSIVGASHEGKFVAEALFDGDARPTLLTSSSLMLKGTEVDWRPPPLRTLSARDASLRAPKHSNAMRRAAALMDALLDDGVPLGDASVLTLDGKGANRTAFLSALSARGVEDVPRILTFEIDAEVALAQRLGLGYDGITFTGADPTFSAKRFGRVGLEHLLIAPNELLPPEERARVVAAYFDYCGGPPRNHSVADCAALMCKVVANLPCLRVVAFTMAKRNHADLHSTFDDYIPPPYGFSLRDTFHDNQNVICKMYVRDSRPRHLRVPGRWWANVPRAEKRRMFDAVVCAEKKGAYTVYVPADDEQYAMREDAVGAYRVP